MDKTKNKQKFKQKKGITLIALVITIIILIILAAISINVLIGENGILNKANRAMLETTKAQVDDEVNLAIQAIRIEIEAQKAKNSEFDATQFVNSKTSGNITIDQSIIEMLQEDLPESKGYTISLKGAQTASIAKDFNPIKISAIEKKTILISYTNPQISGSIDYEAVITHSDIQLTKNKETTSMTEEEKIVWDAEADSVDKFIWASDNEADGELYGTIIGYSDDLLAQESIKIPTRCVKIDGNYEFNTSQKKAYTNYTSLSYKYRSKTINIKSVEIPATVKRISEAFPYFKNLESIRLPDSINYIGENTFLACNNLREIRFPKNIEYIKGGTLDNTAWYNNQDEGAIYIGRVLYKYKGSITTNTTYEIKDGTVTVASHAFESTSIGDSSSTQKTFDGLVGIKVPSSLCYIDEAAFYKCYNMATFEAKKGATMDNITYVGAFNFEYAGGKTYGLLYGGGDDGAAWYLNQDDGPIYIGKVFYTYKGAYPENTEVTIKEGTRTISDYAFYKQSSANLKKVTIPDSVEIINHYAFYGCSNLSEVNMPANITHIGSYAFAYCSKIENITFSANAFQECANDIHDYDVKSGSISPYAFYSCSALKSVTFDENSTKPYLLGSPDVVFKNCTNLQEKPTV